MTPTQKTELLDQAKAHFAADMLRRGEYAAGNSGSFKGCSVGCHLHHIFPNLTVDQIWRLVDKHRKVADYYGYPEWLAPLQDAIFEGLPADESAQWHVQFAETLHGLPDEYDWQSALHRVHAAILRVAYKTAGAAQDIVLRVIALHERAGNGEKIDDDVWGAAVSAAASMKEGLAWSAEWHATLSAAESAKFYVVEDAAGNPAVSATWNTALYVADSAAWSAARIAAWREIRDAVLAALAEGRA